MSCETCESGPGYKSPIDAMCGPRERIIYVTCIQPNGKINNKHDYLATVDVDPDSPTYSTVIHRAFVTNSGDELHHMGWNSCSSCFNNKNAKRDKLILPCLDSSNIYVFDVKNAKEPQLLKVIDNSILRSHEVSAPHTAHCLANGDIMVSCMGDHLGRNKGSFILIDGKSFEFKGLWNDKNNNLSFGYDFWYQPRHNVMISTEWGAPNAFRKGFDLNDVSNNLYGHSLHVWDWSRKVITQRIDLGDSGVMPLEIRFLHNPDATEGYVGCALSSTVYRFFKSNDSWDVQKVISIPSKKVENWLLEDMPALITDILISLDDKYLFVSAWAHGDVRQYDITNTSQPILISQLFIGGLVCNDGIVKVIEDKELDSQPTRPTIGGKATRGGPQMIQLSLDAKRLYVTTSLYSEWDKQFYPEMVNSGAVMVRVNIDDSRQLSLDEHFFVDFGDEPNGAVLAHEMRYPGGDCTSDIWL